MSGDKSQAAFAYEEPPITKVLCQAGLLLSLNIVNACLNKLLYCGLIGQLFVGILWGTPGADWIGIEMEGVIQQLGYLGLILLVYEGGLSMSIKALKADFSLSIAVALTGILTPIALSFVLKDLVSASSLQGFAAGAALSVTSLGTTFTILSITNLISTRLGTVMTCAAILDDVAGLVMVQVIANLGRTNTSLNTVTFIRPVFVSVGLAVVIAVVCSFCLPLLLKSVLRNEDRLPQFMMTSRFSFLAHTLILVGMVAGGTYAGTSSLLAAYLSGVVVKWFDELCAELRGQHNSARFNSQSTDEHDDGASRAQNLQGEMNQAAVPSPSTAAQTLQENIDYAQSYGFVTGNIIYRKYYKDPVERILIPFFFASIGFAIPITEMFQGYIIWRGLVYAILMFFGKVITGLWLLRFSSNPLGYLISLPRVMFSKISCLGIKHQVKPKSDHRNLKLEMKTTSRENKAKSRLNKPKNMSSSGQPAEGGRSPTRSAAREQIRNPQNESTLSSGNRFPFSPKPKSLYPASILGVAMVARGEIGYLIASLAQSQGIFSTDTEQKTSDIYLVLIWAISICTLISPVAVGILTQRVRKLQLVRANSGGEDPLGVWGI